MEQHTKDLFKKIFKQIIENEHNNALKYSLVVPVVNDWAHQLPEHVLSSKYMKLDITEWSMEETYITDQGVHVTVAFGSDENYKLFTFEQILSVLDSKDNIIITNYLYGTIPEPVVEMKHTLKGLIKPTNDPEG